MIQVHRAQTDVSIREDKAVVFVVTVWLQALKLLLKVFFFCSCVNSAQQFLIHKNYFIFH